MDRHGLIMQATAGAGGPAREAIAKLVMMLRSWKSQEETEGGRPRAAPQRGGARAWKGRDERNRAGETGARALAAGSLRALAAVRWETGSGGPEALCLLL